MDSTMRALSAIQQTKKTIHIADSDLPASPDCASAPCRLCGSYGLSLIRHANQHKPRKRPFYLCSNCGLISVPAEYHLSVGDELTRYGLHDNNLSNQGYVRFLTEIAEIAVGVATGMPRTGLSMSNPKNPPITLLDFGCGKEAVLCRLLGHRGIVCYPYDPLYGLPLPDAVTGYDIIVACEVVEHLRDIAGELRLIGRLLPDDGTLIIRTQLYDSAGIDTDSGDMPAFQDWWYTQDPTHINFFNRKSLSWLASAINKRVEETEQRDIFVLRSNDLDSAPNLA